jgi:hypothetical protein
LYTVLRIVDFSFQCPTSAAEWEKVADDYMERWNFPNCLGSIDGKHCTIRQPACSGAKFFNYKHTFSVVLLAVVDAHYRFLFCDVGAQGRLSDGAVYGESMLKKSLERNTLGVPPARPLPGRNDPFPYCLIGDDAFPLKEYLQKPYPQRNLTHDQRVFNYRLSRARRCVENAFGVMVSRFRVMLNPMCLQPDKVDVVILACCVLHNMLRTLVPGGYMNGKDIEDPDTHIVLDGSWRLDKQLPQAVVAGRRSASQSSQRNRDYLCEYFMSEEGRVHWQEDMIK